MGFVPPELRPSYADVTRSLTRAVLVAALVAVVAMNVATLGEALKPSTVALVALPVSIPGGIWLTRIFLQRRTGYVIPWWISTVGVAATWVATPWGGGWLVREILAGTFGSEGLEEEEAQEAQEPAQDVPPAPTPLLDHTAIEPAPLPAPLTVVEPLPDPAALPLLRVAGQPAAVDPVVEALAEAAPPPGDPAPELEPVAVFPLPDLPVPFAELELEPDPEPVQVAAPVEPPLFEAPPVVEDDPAPLDVLPAFEEDELPFFLPASELEPAAAHDPFSTFWLDPDAPPPNGLTPGYLPPLTAMWQTPLGDRL